MNARMPGKRCPEGPGGRDCYCCGQPPGKGRRIKRRSLKQGEKHSVRKSIRQYLSR